MVYVPDDPTDARPLYHLLDPDPTVHVAAGDYCGAEFTAPDMESGWHCTRERGHAGIVHVGGSGRSHPAVLHVIPFIGAIWSGKEVTDEAVSDYAKNCLREWTLAHPKEAAREQQQGLEALMTAIMDKAQEMHPHSHTEDDERETERRGMVGAVLAVVGDNGVMDDLPADAPDGLVEEIVTRTQQARLEHGVCPAVLRAPGRRMPWLCMQKMHKAGDHVSYDPAGKVQARWGMTGDLRSLIVTEPDVTVEHDWDQLFQGVTPPTTTKDDDEHTGD